MSKRLDLVNQRFGRLTVISFTGIDNNCNSLWECKCDCGNITTVRGNFLKDGHTKSCGCDRKSSHFTHKKSKTRLYVIWKNMKSRCYYKNNNSFKNYGERGIVVCDEWKNNYESFEKWAINNGYVESSGYKCTIDRIDPNGNYCPENCRWVSPKEQSRNKRNTIYLEYNNQKKPLTEWCEIYNIDYPTARYRYKNNFSFEKIFEIN